MLLTQLLFKSEVRQTLDDTFTFQARHYDWKLRAIKTTLYVAGGMKRAAPDLTEDKVLLRALRDFNLGKLTSDDTGIFLGLLNDLFPKTLELVPRAVDTVFETQCRKSAKELRYQPDDMFCLKISQVLPPGLAPRVQISEPWRSIHTCSRDRVALYLHYNIRTAARTV